MSRALFNTRAAVIGASAALVLFVGALAAPASAALQMQWKFDEGSGTTASDSSSNGRSGTLVDSDATNGDGDTPPEWFNTDLPPVPSGTSSALRFDATDDVVEADGYDGVTGTTARTASAWIRTSTDNVTNFGPIVTWGRKNTGGKWAMRIDSSRSGDKLRVDVDNGAIIATTDIADQEWHHVAATWKDDGSPDIEDAKLYVDGELDPLTVVASQTINTDSKNLKVGEDRGDRHFPGDIDEVRIYNEALSGSEIESLAVIPEPASLALLAPAGLLLARRRRSRAGDAR